MVTTSEGGQQARAVGTIQAFKNKFGGSGARSTIGSLARVILVLLTVLCVAYIFAYVTVYKHIYEYCTTLAVRYYWITPTVSAWLAGGIAASLTSLVLWALIRLSVGYGDVRSYALVGSALTVVLLTAYIDRNKYFQAGNGALYICAPAHPDDPASIEHMGQGELEGRRCLLLTPANAAIGRAIDKQKAPKSISAASADQLHSLQWFRNGAPAVYLGNIADKDGIPKLYDGPGFDPDSPEFLIPASVQLRSAMIEALASKEEKTKRAQEANDALALATQRKAAAEEEEKAKQRTKQEAEARVEAAKREAEAKVEAAKRETEERLHRHVEQERLRQSQRDSENSKRRVDLNGYETYTVPKGYWVPEYGGGVKFFVGDQQYQAVNEALFRRFDSQVIARPQHPNYFFRDAAINWIVTQKFVE